MDIRKTRFSEWLESHFVNWISKQGKPKNITEFAKYLNVNRTLLGRWLKGTSIPENENVIKLGNKLGFEIYDLLGWERPNDPNV